MKYHSTLESSVLFGRYRHMRGFFFFFCLIILAFSLCKTMAANYKNRFLSAVHQGLGGSNPTPPSHEGFAMMKRTKTHMSSTLSRTSPLRLWRSGVTRSYIAKTPFAPTAGTTKNNEVSDNALLSTNSGCQPFKAHSIFTQPMREF